MKKVLNSLIFKLLVGVFLGAVIGLYSPVWLMNIIVTVKSLFGQIIFFIVPLIIIGFIAPSIAKLKSNASKLLTLAIVLAYVSSVGAATLSTIAGYTIIPHLTIQPAADGLRELPKLIFDLQIPPVMSVMSALMFSIVIGLATAWTKSDLFEKLLDQFQNIVLTIVSKIVIPILPLFIGTTFATLAYEGSITKQVPVFISVILIVIVGHFIWMALLYGVAGAYSGKNPARVFKHYGPAYLTAVGTMSSAATLPVALTSARKSDALRSDIIDFGVPLFANIHLCGSVLTETFFVMTVSQILYGKLPSVSSMIIFIILLGIFAIGAPGVPGGTVMASLGLISSVLLFDEAGLALMLTIFALQDSFGTACNVTGDGALTLILTGFVEKHHIKAEV
ncbi:Na+/H+-dicarboxylate symporter [Hydrogenoanaerobacterium saccharovorans]|uniref:Na+/H+-dicarboxylate symporter n=1 Tax=Hydrogenoanaerobacterium saccharovorans TaxID=474960 RepID=A0A1H8B803_9FIRM|nr:dicarboxylate/amino acid:cation symporter [Hydrogenoanaerobacterium saccharovorans]RPF47535.1 Na+/H+-dicarboxylate symporter [Hydrogenoanaerobacterium saccharovorans]SEM79065.1 Na+/H+-dicarboxylate symporter [Hydrogenoanaerobacterium saccharovorans]